MLTISVYESLLIATLLWTRKPIYR